MDEPPSNFVVGYWYLVSSEGHYARACFEADFLGECWLLSGEFKRGGFFAEITKAYDPNLTPEQAVERAERDLMDFVQPPDDGVSIGWIEVCSAEPEVVQEYMEMENRISGHLLTQMKELGLHG